ncbi:MAG TPA: hypothetical protein VFN27_14635, partial [Xanthobacteraceae bacterium]|nr:hypothetical protein [Xanthobacteraceae bacterium]
PQTGRGIGMRPITHHPPYFKARLISLSQSPSLTGQNNDSISSFFRKLLACCLSMIFSDLASPAEASNERASGWRGFAQAGNRYPLFGIML